MTETEKLYWADPERLTFETHDATVSEFGGKPSLVLPATLFYPEGGGQLGDVGFLELDGQRCEVVDTQIDDRGVIHHMVATTPTSFGVVKGVIDHDRRRDHMAQHTGQHALSRALADLARAETVSARLGKTTCTIDVSRASIPDADLHRAEDLVNGLIASNVPVRSLYPSREELAGLPLRKQPKVEEGTIRIIDIEGFDMTPCGGTHCTRTGQIGQARIVGLEKYKGMLRLTFHAGLRALTDARAKHDALLGIATELTCGIADVPGAVTKLRTELKASRTALDLARAELAELVARTTLASLNATSPVVVPVMRAGDEIGTLRLLAGKLAENPNVIALVGTNDAATGELVVVVQRGASCTFDCGAFIKAKGSALGGRGGGKTERAEGRFPKGTTLDALEASAN